MPFLRIAGVDEAGRGPLAGPVVAAAVILDPHQPILGLNDSKKLTEKQREYLFAEIQSKALAFSIAEASVHEIDTLNILQASLLAMQRAVATLSIMPDECLIDGNRCPALPYPARAIIGGDAIKPSISAASILAKVFRDRLMTQLGKTYSNFNFKQHKGYPTQLHYQELALNGPTAIHRKSFRLSTIKP